MADLHTAQWVTNAVNVSGRAPGAAKADKTGAIDPTGKITGPSLPDVDDSTLYQHLANLGYIKAHGDPVVFAALQHYLDGPTGFYAGIGAMQFHLSQRQFLGIRAGLSGADLLAFDAAVSLHIGRATTDYAPSNAPIPASKQLPPIFAKLQANKNANKIIGAKGAASMMGDLQITHGDLQITHMGLDISSGQASTAASAAAQAGIHVQPGDIQTASDVATSLASGDYVGAATQGSSAGGAAGDIAQGAVIGASIAAGTGTIVAAGAAIGTAIPIPVVGTAIGAAAGAAVAAGIVVGRAIANAINAPLYNDGDYQRMRDQCEEAGGTVQAGIAPDQPTACMFPDGYRSGGYFPVWPADKQASYDADQADRAARLGGLANFMTALHAIDQMCIDGKKQVTAKTGTPAVKQVWMDKIRKLYSDAYQYTAPDREAKIDAFMNTDSMNVSSRLGNPPLPKPLNVTLKTIPHSVFATQMITQGAVGAPPPMKQAIVAPGMATPQGLVGVAQGIATVQAKKENIFFRMLEKIHLRKKPVIATS